MRETKTDWGRRCPRWGQAGLEAETEGAKAPLEEIRWVTVTAGSADALRGALRRDEGGPYLLCGCGQILRPGDELLAAGEHFYCPDCAQGWLAANLSRLGGVSP